MRVSLVYICVCVFLFQTNDALVAPLLRLKDNNCHVEESERVLKKKEKFSELIILYEKKGEHQKGELVMNISGTYIRNIQCTYCSLLTV
jgi:hypothetical protein